MFKHDVFSSDIDECSTSTPCSNSGTCNNSPGSYSCDCTGTGYNGTYCDDGKIYTYEK